LHHFELIDGELHCEAVPLSRIAETVGAPAYVYSTVALKDRLRAYRDAFPADALIAYAVKANGNLSVLRTLAELGAGADTVSEGEIRRSLAAGVPSERIVFSGMGKTDAELAYAAGLPGLQINVESEPELRRLSRLAGDGRPPTVLRVNPDVAAGGHVKIATGKAHDKFGIPEGDVVRLYAEAARDPRLRAMGLACHIGSQIFDLTAFETAWTKLRTLTIELRGEGFVVDRLDLGGGLAVSDLRGPPPPTPGELGALARRLFDGFGVHLSVEPGRSIVADAGVLVSRVTHVNARTVGPRFLVLDAGMNDLIRPTLYDAFHDLRPVRPRAGEVAPFEVVGPVCETGDAFARDRMLPPLEAGDLVAFMTAGAYGAAMASEYNARPLVPEVLVSGDRFAVIRPRPSYDDMMAREPLAPWL
jgi:diaminopimelate decarboxylase